MNSTQYDQVAKQLFRSILSQQSLVYNQINSYDHFLGSDLGIKSIIQNMFKISNPILIEPTEVVIEGKKRVIKSIYVEVSFHNAQVESRQPSDEEIRLFVQKGMDREVDAKGQIELQKMKY